jgi:hypothetical protein
MLTALSLLDFFNSVRMVSRRMSLGFKLYMLSN